jgi:hypothetical protein
MPKATNTPTTPHPDHELRILGEALTDANKRLGAEDLDEVQRLELTEKVLNILSTMCSVEARTKTGHRIKAGAIITAFARTGEVHKLALSLCGDILASSQ